MSQNYIYYGTQTHAAEVIGFIEHMLKVNSDNHAEGRPGTPLCIWGRHGIGKTQIVEAIARDKKYDFAYIAPAQFEEMGDLLGMPVVDGESTRFKPPAWVPQEEGPGILLIDDVNRADDRILRGIMQLLQNSELVSWRLPRHWHIILTANPDGGDYSVTPMDAAMLTRMMHVTLKFEVKAWAAWAEDAGIDARGINFVLTYPEIVDGERTTPRSLVQFFNAIAHIKDLEAELPLVQLIADSCLEGNAAISFINFVKNNLSKLITPEQIIEAKDFSKSVEAPIKKVVQKDSLRVDILSTLCTRLVNYLGVNKVKPSKDQLANIKAFLMMEFLPNDLRLITAQDLVNSKNTHLKLIVADKDIAALLLKKM